MTDREITQVALGVGIVGAWVWTAVRVGRLAPQYGRRTWVWTVVSLLATALPAMLVFWVDYFRGLSAREQLPQFGRRLRTAPDAGEPESPETAETPATCPHCGQPVPDRRADTCPHCNMSLNQDNYA